ncbi:hypothetical protein [Actinoplanes couchii]|uniref:Uncharacterized protein n=1 Tax=Actinoplanes couchii TaxID=403638 RepID=A0ABQ3XDP6_9ACTN|nr:hypothetical protein [Actinoplanes couchii]MDR6317141.1 hypothetical protein [Actinoplanes couchii]GID56635.1 hypothetical protein Aco03nite_050390 [Actinoplanes couchii]
MIDRFGLEELRRVPLGGLGEWLRAESPGPVPPQWCLAIVGSAESAGNPFRPATTAERIADLTLGAELLSLAVERRDIDPATGGYWLIRLATVALRLGLTADDVPPPLTPDGAAGWALDRMPLSRETAIATARTRRDEYPGEDAYLAPDAAERGLQGVEQVLHVLPWIIEHLRDRGIRREAEAWLAIEDQL